MWSVYIHAAVVLMAFMTEWVGDPAGVGSMVLSYFNLKIMLFQHVELASPQFCCSNFIIGKMDMRDHNRFDVNILHYNVHPVCYIMI